MRADQLQGLFEEHAQQLFGFLMYRTGDRSLAEDVLSDTFERALRSRRLFDRQKGTEKTWLYSIALNRLRDTQRRSVKEREIVGKLTRPEGHLSFEERIASQSELTKALETLPAAEREALALRYGADLTVPEVARLLGEPLSRVEGRVYRGLAKLRVELDSDG